MDRFGRVVDQRWRVTADGSPTDRFQYGYDRDSNRLYRENLLDAAFSELYSYDDLNQLLGFQRGELNASKDGLIGAASRSQDWALDALGNWDTLTTDGTPQGRTHNRQNQVTAVGGNTLTFDANGNTTTDDGGRTLTYDAWNRLVSATSGAQSVSFNYDALNRRLTEAVVGGTTTDLYYSAAWQVLEERVSGVVTAQYVWSPVYVDALVLRDRDADSDGNLEERLYAQQDANYNVTALLDAAGNVVERYTYDPYGQVTVLTAGWVDRGVSLFAWVYLHQGGRFEQISNTYHFRYRDLSAALGRWLQRDPIEYASDDTNIYRYLFNGPLVLVICQDPPR